MNPFRKNGLMGLFDQLPMIAEERVDHFTVDSDRFP